MALLITGAEGPAGKSGIKPGSKLLSINGEPVLDFVDYNWYSAQTKLDIEIETERGCRVHHITKDADEPIGLDVEGLYPDERQCANHCVFCFVDQLPCNMRESLYVKDDDWRYSVLFGNYITLTNISDREFERLLSRAPSPLYVSVHSTDIDVRTKMMGNPKAGRIMEQLARLTNAGIVVHCQIVLVPGYNDGESLKKSLSDLYTLYPRVRTVAVVPLGLTCHRAGLAELRPVGRAEACSAVQIVEQFTKRSRVEHNVRFAFASDEMVERAGLPAIRYLEGEHTPQLANGVGMISDFLDDFEWALDDLPESLAEQRVATIATGVSAYGLMEKITSELERKVKNLKLNVIKVENKLFGPEVTVAGLICGKDIADTAARFSLGQELLVPQAALRSGEEVFLDDMTLGQLSCRLGIPVKAVPCDGAALAYAACGLEETIG
jgi:putative radical SAM enzyme (TIGR03279 family)